jgi:hypothetical protein
MDFHCHQQVGTQEGRADEGVLVEKARRRKGQLRKTVFGERSKSIEVLR